MNILMLGRWLPVGRGAAGRREYAFGRHLAQEHQLTVAFTTDDGDDGYGADDPARSVRRPRVRRRPRGWKYLSGAISLATGDSCTLAYFRSTALSARLADRMKTAPYDLVYVSSSSMIQYALELDSAVPLVVDFGEVDSEWWRRQAELRSFPGANFYRTEAARLRSAEAAAAARASACLVASRQAGTAVGRFAPWAPLTVVATPETLDAPGETELADLSRVISLVTRGGRGARRADDVRALMTPRSHPGAQPDAASAPLADLSTHPPRRAIEQRTRA